MICPLIASYRGSLLHMLPGICNSRMIVVMEQLTETPAVPVSEALTQRHEL
jgi:hypothetical protein